MKAIGTVAYIRGNDDISLTPEAAKSSMTGQGRVVRAGRARLAYMVESLERLGRDSLR